MGFVDLIHETRSIFTALWQEIIAVIPRLAGAFAVFLLGFFLARFFRSLVQGIVAGMIRLAPARFHVESATFRPGRAAELSGRFAYGLTLLVSFIGAVEVAGLPVMKTWFGGLTAYLPRIMVAALIGLSGIVAAVFMRDVIIRAAATARLDHPVLLGQTGYAAVLMLTLLFALDQAGLNIWVLGTLMIVVVGSLLFGAILTFSLGAYQLVTHILASYFLQRVLRVGDRIRVGEAEGRILHFTPIHLVIETSEGQCQIPNRTLVEDASYRILKKDES